ncbi:uncharacterized protein LOC121390012 isoform X2 [Gigantopelta aegis]|uniref:uncharacterized protein LOC121390012 isoform X2 n=1 Tax=Gigantopelta aegis TaxID=1735272 RepID=UPI001B88CC6B|nr:uncharacterized protein LOC121390012 isoform X2 [Gigantopelta aegis]
MEPTTTWQIIVLIVILMTHFSQANKACPTESTRNSNFPVIHLCTNEAASDVQGVFLDAFVSANNPVSCSCTLETRQSLQIGINPVILPDRNCTSTLHISSSQGPVIYNCKKINITIPMYRRNLQNEGVFIKLTTRAGNENTTYCISLIITDGQGSLTLQCHSPDGRSMSSSTQPYDKTTSLRSTTLSSSRTESTKSEKADTSSPLTGPVKSEISDTTVPVEKTNIHTEPKAFPGRNEQKANTTPVMMTMWTTSLGMLILITLIRILTLPSLITMLPVLILTTILATRMNIYNTILATRMNIYNTILYSMLTRRRVLMETTCTSTSMNQHSHRSQIKIIITLPT